MNRILKLLPSLLFLLFALSAALPVFAQPGVLPPADPVTFGDIELLIEDIAFFIIYVSGVILVIMIIWAGIVYATAGGEQNRVSQAKTILKNGIIAALIIFGVGTILATVSYVIESRSFY